MLTPLETYLTADKRGYTQIIQSKPAAQLIVMFLALLARLAVHYFFLFLRVLLCSVFELIRVYLRLSAVALGLKPPANP
jgi:hypothetical protein